MTMHNPNLSIYEITNEQQKVTLDGLFDICGTCHAKKVYNLYGIDNGAGRPKSGS